MSIKLSKSDLERICGKDCTLEEFNCILTNEELRNNIVDLADLWDGKESSHYGDRLKELLDVLEIKDTPEFYKKENVDKFIKEMDEHRIVQRLVNRIHMLEKDKAFYEKAADPYSYAHYKATYFELQELKKLYKADTNI